MNPLKPSHRSGSLAGLFMLLLLASHTAVAVPTHIMVRAQSLDAKFIADGIGGARVLIEDAESGELLDQGMIRGSTGDTERIMSQPHQRRQRLSDEGTGGYLATVDIERPRWVRIRVLAPYGRRQALQEASVTTWVLPGRDLTAGDGIVLQMPGLIVDGWTQMMKDGRLMIMAEVTMLCGCPITPDGLWKAEEFTLEALPELGGERFGPVEMKFSSESGLFIGEFRPPKPGTYRVLISAFQPSTGNTGVARTQRKVSLP
ncbi:MAG: hypothetical protein D6786_08685 [Gammaproteobacteria bacterium]|nr:MAG: hypothetical protein D6786_08685 [Gammaproteobacteria bacterium]